MLIYHHLLFLEQMNLHVRARTASKAVLLDNKIAKKAKILSFTHNLTGGINSNRKRSGKSLIAQSSFCLKYQTSRCTVVTNNRQ